MKKEGAMGRVRCTSTTTTDEKAVGGGVEELVGAVRAYVKGGETTKVEGGRGVEEVVAKLKEANVEASAGRMETRGGRNGLEVVVRVVTEGKGEAKFVGRVEVVPRVVRVVVMSERERAVRKARVEFTQNGNEVKIVGDRMYWNGEEYGAGTGLWVSYRAYACYPIEWGMWWICAVNTDDRNVMTGILSSDHRPNAATVVLAVDGGPWDYQGKPPSDFPEPEGGSG